MNLLVFGASGPTGRQMVAQALARGHAVTVFVRDPRAFADMDGQVRVVTGDTTRDEMAIAAAVRGQDAVVSTLGRRATFRSDHLMERSLRLIVPAMEAAGVKRLVLMSSFGVGASLREAPFVPRLMYRVLLSDIFRDKAVAEEYVGRSNLNWTVVYPVLLTDGPLTRSYRAAEHLELRGLPKISRADVAHFMLGEVAGSAYLRKKVVISY